MANKLQFATTSDGVVCFKTEALGAQRASVVQMELQIGSVMDRGSRERERERGRKKLFLTLLNRLVSNDISLVLFGLSNLSKFSRRFSRPDNKLAKN